MARDEHRVFSFEDRAGETYQIGDGGAHLNLTPEILQQALLEQQSREAASPHVLLSPSMAHVEKARREAVDWLEAARAVEAELHNDHTKAERKELRQRFNHLMKLLAESLATMGNYEEALMVLPQQEVALRKEYKQTLRAINRDDSERCGQKCEDAFQADPTTVTRERVVKNVFSKKHGRLMPMITCNAPGCEDFNVRAADGELAKQIEVRARAIDLTKGDSPERAREKLRQAGLTSEKVLR